VDLVRRLFFGGIPRRLLRLLAEAMEAPTPRWSRKGRSRRPP